MNIPDTLMTDALFNHGLQQCVDFIRDRLDAGAPPETVPVMIRIISISQRAVDAIANGETVDGENCDNFDQLFDTTTAAIHAPTTVPHDLHHDIFALAGREYSNARAKSYHGLVVALYVIGRGQLIRVKSNAPDTIEGIIISGITHDVRMNSVVITDEGNATDFNLAGAVPNPTTPSPIATGFMHGIQTATIARFIDKTSQ
jgi:hypothetical protein